MNKLWMERDLLLFRRQYEIFQFSLKFLLVLHLGLLECRLLHPAERSDQIVIQPLLLESRDGPPCNETWNSNSWKVYWNTFLRLYSTYILNHKFDSIKTSVLRDIKKPERVVWHGLGTKFLSLERERERERIIFFSDALILKTQK